MAAAVGAVLIERSTRHLRLTDAGLLLHRYARRILDDVGEAENAIAGLVGSPRGDLRISVPFTFATGPLAQMLSGFLERYPEVRVVLTFDNRPIDLLIEEIDVAIRIGPLQDSELIARRLVTFALWPCASLADLARHAPMTAKTAEARELWTSGQFDLPLEPARLPWTTLRVAHRACLCPLAHSPRPRRSRRTQFTQPAQD